MDHKEKQAIFDKYAREKEYADWESLISEHSHGMILSMSDTDLIELQNHIFEACDLVQKEQQERIAGVARIEKFEDAPMPSMITYIIDKSSITNPKNLIK